MNNTTHYRWPLRYRIAKRLHGIVNQIHRATGQHRLTAWLNGKVGSLWIDWWLSTGRHEQHRDHQPDD